MNTAFAIKTGMDTGRGKFSYGTRRKTAPCSATIHDGRDDNSDSGGGIKKTVAIVAHRRGTRPFDKCGDGNSEPATVAISWI